MSYKPFVHLHNHSDCSFLDGAIPVPDLIQAAYERGMPAVAITDHGSLFGLLEFYKEAIKKGLKPILGCEANVVREGEAGSAEAGQPGVGVDHLVLLARNMDGYRNLMKIATLANVESRHPRFPAIDKAVLAANGKGLIGLSGCVRGEIPRLLLSGGESRAKAALKSYQEIFGKAHFFLELQNHGLDDELIANERIIRLAQGEGAPLVATNDVHYLSAEDHEAHDVLLCIQQQVRVTDTNRMRFPTDQHYFKTYEEMLDLFKEVPEALENTVRIAEMCNVHLELDTHYYWPKAPRAKGFADDDTYLRHLALEGLPGRYPGALRPEMAGLEERLDFELKVMAKMQVSGYMLIVCDIIKAAQNMGIPVGPGRGSCVGSLVSYAVGITSVDPLRHNLLFERFLNPERVSMPDIDIDFADRGRDRVIRYVIEKYGKESVVQIGTLGSMKAKAVLRDVARALNVPLLEVNDVCKQVPFGPKVTLEQSLKEVPELKETFDRSELYRKWLRVGLRLEGLKRQPGVHAAGVIIASGNVLNYSPLYAQKDTDMLITQYDKNNVESAGLLKMDFLGLRNLTVIQEALREVERNAEKKVDIDRIPLEDSKTFEIFAKGETVGIFQFESSGMKEYLRKLKPTHIEDIIAMNALYRPGPMDNIPSYIKRKHGNEPIDYYHERIEEVLKDTYGIIVYQEQVMQIAQVVGGFSLAKADILRRAMGKKKPEEMARMKAEFLAGAKSNKVGEKLAEKIFDLLAKFAEYGFNKSHAAAYSYVAFQTAYLKAHFPVEFMAANLTSELGDTDRVVILMSECKRMGITVMPPDINRSFVDFRAHGDKILFGMGAIKNVGVGAVEAIIAERDKGEPFKTVFDLCSRVDIRVMNKRVLEALIFSGTLDGLQGNRSQLYAAVEMAMEYGAAFQRDREQGQTSLFDVPGGEKRSIVGEPKLPEVDPLSYPEVLKKEKSVLGFYVSGHPLKDYEDEIRGLSSLKLDPHSLTQYKQKEKVSLGGIVTAVRRIIDKKGKPMAFVQVESFDGILEIIVYSSLFEEVRIHLREDTAVFVLGGLDRTNEEQPKILADKILSLGEARERFTRSVHVRLHTPGLEEAHLKEIHRLCAGNAGPCSIVLHTVDQGGNEFVIRSKNVRVGHQREFLLRLRDVAGEENVWLGRDY